jgi:site-specific DNA recombinase
VADLDDPAPNERIAGLKSTRDQAQADAERTADALDSAGQPTITSAMVRKFAATARERLRITGGGIFARSRNASRSPTARSEIMGSKSDLLKTLEAASGTQPATFGVRSSVPKWRPQGDSNPCYRRERGAKHAYPINVDDGGRSMYLVFIKTLSTPIHPCSPASVWHICRT